MHPSHWRRTVAALCLVAGTAAVLAAQNESGALPNGKFDPALSPDGSRIAFAWNGGQGGNSGIYVNKLCSWPVVSCKGAPPQPVRLTTGGAAELNPAWSPDGRQIAFCRRTARGTDVLVVPAGGGPERRLCGSAALLPRPSWTPDGKSLAMADKASASDPGSIFVVSVENGEKRRLSTPGPDGAGDGTPAVSPDGRTVAFSRAVKNTPGEIWLAPLAGGAPRRLEVGFGTEHARAAIRGLAWSEDGGSILVASAGLWKVSAAGGKAERLAESDGEVQSVSASRQGRRLVYAEVVPEVEMWRTAGPASRPEEFPPTRLLGSPDDVGSPNVAPGGNSIAFGSFMSGTWEVWKCDRDGRNPVQLTFLGDVPTGSPRWSPDGKNVVFDGRAEDGLLNDIYVVDAAGGAARRLTKEPSVDIRPCFSRDRRWVYFTSNRSGTFQIWKIPAQGGEAAQVTRNGGFVAFETPDGKFLYYGKGRGQTNLWRVSTGGGEEVQVLDDVDASNFAVCELGVCILNLKAKPKPAIEFYSFATRKRTTLPVLPQEGKAIGSGTSLAASPDGRWLVYHQEGRAGAGIRARSY